MRQTGVMVPRLLILQITHIHQGNLNFTIALQEFQLFRFGEVIIQWEIFYQIIISGIILLLPDKKLVMVLAQL